MNEPLFIMDNIIQRSFFECWGMGDDSHLPGPSEPSDEVDSSDGKPSNLQEAFACMQELFEDPEREGRKNLQEDILEDFSHAQPARTLGVGGPYEDAKPDDHIVMLKYRLPGDFTEDDEDWGSRIF
ncbi:MAG: hypothetical protein WC087_01450 [Candidatus Paceibacterota bacterium]